MKQPTPLQIREARELTGMTQTYAASLVHVPLRTWQKWEGGERRMHLAFWELWQLKACGYAP